MPMNKVVHAAQRAAFSAAIDSAIKAVRGKGPENMAEQAVKLVNLAQPLLAHRYPDADWDKVRAFVSDPGSKWMEYAYKAINEIDPHILKMNTLNLVYEGMFAGYNYVMELRRKYDCNMPWILLFDPTSACNLHCKGCWAAEYGNRLNLSFEDMDRIVTEGEALGIHWYMCTGGEPTCRKEDLFKLAAKHQNSVFHLFTNGTLIDQAFCDRVKEVGNMAFFISIEGIGDATDDRRGEGVYDRVMHAMDLMKENGLLFGTGGNGTELRLAGTECAAAAHSGELGQHRRSGVETQGAGQGACTDRKPVSIPAGKCCRCGTARSRASGNAGADSTAAGVGRGIFLCSQGTAGGNAL